MVLSSRSTLRPRHLEEDRSCSDNSMLTQRLDTTIGFLPLLRGDGKALLKAANFSQQALQSLIVCVSFSSGGSTFHSSTLKTDR